MSLLDSKRVTKCRQTNCPQELIHELLLTGNETVTMATSLPVEAHISPQIHRNVSLLLCSGRNKPLKHEQKSTLADKRVATLTCRAHKHRQEVGLTNQEQQCTRGQRSRVCHLQEEKERFLFELDVCGSLRGRIRASISIWGC